MPGTLCSPKAARRIVIRSVSACLSLRPVWRLQPPVVLSRFLDIPPRDEESAWSTS